MSQASPRSPRSPKSLKPFSPDPSPMHVFQDAYNASDLPRGGVGTIGNFDGVHRGQRAILERLTARAESSSVPAVVITFDPHPLTVLAPEKAPIALTTQKQNEELLET